MAAFSRILRHTCRHPWLSLLSLLLAVVCTSLVLVLPGVTLRFVDVILGQNRPELIPATVATGLSAILVRQLLFTARTYLNNSLELKLGHGIRLELYQKLQRLPVRWFDANASGEVMSRVSNDVPAMNRIIIEGVDQALAAVLQLLVVIGYMLWHSWQLTLVTLAPLPFIGIITFWWTRRSEPMWRASSEASAAMNAILHDHLAGIRQIKAFTVEQHSLKEFGKASRDIGEKHMNVMRGQAVVWPAVSFIAESGIILMVACGSWWSLQGQLSPGVVISFLVAWGFLFDPISRINPLSQTFTRGVVSAKRVFAIIDTPEEADLDAGKKPATLTGGLSFEHVCFRYDDSAPALNDFTLKVSPGQTVALVGPTGAGKSTVLHLLARFYEPTSGIILLDGQPLGSICKSWLRSRIGYVTQESFLFNASLRDNLLLGNAVADDNDIWQALEAAHAADFVRKLPQGLDTLAGERGSRFSGGERQRLSIARALLRNPPLLLLDEATSALDNRSERLVQHALDRLRADRTCLVIAHRLTTVERADLICVMDKGGVVECGTHDELLQLAGRYSALCETKLVMPSSSGA